MWNNGVIQTSPIGLSFSVRLLDYHSFIHHLLTPYYVLGSLSRIEVLMKKSGMETDGYDKSLHIKAMKHIGKAPNAGPWEVF